MSVNKQLTGTVLAEFNAWLNKQIGMSLSSLICYKGGKEQAGIWFVDFIDSHGLNYLQIETDVYNIPRQGITSLKEMNRRVIDECIKRYKEKYKLI